LLNLNELHVQITDAVTSVTPQMMEDTWHETEYYLDTLQATSGTHIETLEWSIQTQQTISLCLLNCMFYVCNVVIELWAPCIIRMQFSPK